MRFEDGKLYLLRVVVAGDEEPPLVITAYRTSKIEEYWKGIKVVYDLKVDVLSVLLSARRSLKATRITWRHPGLR